MDAELTVSRSREPRSPGAIAFPLEPFVAAIPKEHLPGLGMGLYIAKAIVQAHGGTIAAQSAVGKGTTIVVRVPV